MVYSDHAPFWDQGYLALCNIEDFWVENPYYHTPGDTIGSGYNDNEFCTEVTKAEIAALALLAVPYSTGIEEFEGVAAEDSRLTVWPTIGKSLFTISFTNASTGRLDLTIHDVTGRVVRSILVPPSDIGHQLSVRWDGTDNTGKKLPEGVYFVQSSGSGTTSKAKLVLLR
jgi:hypothetical protein